MAKFLTQLLERDSAREVLSVALLDHAIVMVDDDERISEFNGGASAIFGYTRDEIVGQHVSVLFTPEDVDAGVPQQELRDARERSKTPDARWHRRRDGSHFWADGITAAVQTANGWQYCKVARDATAQKLDAMQLAVQAATARVIGSNDSIGDVAAALLDIICDELGWQLGHLWLVSEDEQFIECVGEGTDRRAREISDAVLCSGERYARGVGLPGMIWQQRAPMWLDDLRAHQLPRAERLVAQGFETAVGFPVTAGESVIGVLEFFTRFPRVGEPMMMETLSVVGSHLAQFLERVRSEASRVRAEQEYRLIAETAADAIVTIDAKSNVVFANPAVERIFGWKPEELMHRNLSVLMPPGFRERHDAGMNRVITTGERRIPWSGVELSAVHRDGHAVPIEISFGRVKLDGQDYFTGIMRDISARRASEEENRRLYREAQEANRAKDEFLATVSHELRTPMTAVLGWTRLLKVDPDPETMREGLAAIERSASAQAQLIDDILDVSRITAGKLRFRAEPVELGAVVRSAIETVRVTSEARGVSLLSDIPMTEEFPMLGDAARLQQVVWNLLTNALKFTPAGGQVIVSLRCENGKARLAVRDTGEGIAPEFLPRLFERFRQAESSSKRTHGGLGLGLSIVRHLVDLHGGTVWAESEGLGRGSTFTIELPVGREERSSDGGPRRRRATDAPLSLDKTHIIVVEDDADTRGFLVKVLTRAGGEVRAAASVSEARQLLRSALPDIIVSDLAMPAEDGYDLIAELKGSEQWRELPIIAVTASGGAGDRERALAAGFDLYLRKPVDPAVLVEAIASLLRERQSV